MVASLCVPSLFESKNNFLVSGSIKLGFNSLLCILLVLFIAYDLDLIWLTTLYVTLGIIIFFICVSGTFELLPGGVSQKDIDKYLRFLSSFLLLFIFIYTDRFFIYFFHVE